MAAPPLAGAVGAPRVVRALIVLVNFSDTSLSQTPQSIETLFFSTGRALPSGSVKEYYDEVSRGAISLEGDVIGPFTLPNTMAHYANGRSGQAATQPNTQTMVSDLLDAIGPRAYGPYDNNGDGRVDAFVVVHAGHGAEFSGQPNDIWSLKWTLPGDPVTGTDGVSVFAFLTVPEDTPIGIAAHELGHLLFGLPDLYDLSGHSSGVGAWCLMGGGCWNGGGHTPAHLSAYCKFKVGWGPLAESLSQPASITFDPNWGPPGAARQLRMSSQQYLLLEQRGQHGFDSALPGAGLLVWHVDESRPPDQSQGLTVTLIQADGRDDLGAGTNNGDAGDPFPGVTGKAALTSATQPGIVPNAPLQACTIAITQIDAVSLAPQIRAMVQP